MNMADTLKHLMRTAVAGGKPMRQVDLARKSGVPQPTISRILSGQHKNIDAETARKLASVFGVTASQLRGEEPLTPPIPKELADILTRLSREGLLQLMARAIEIAGREQQHQKPDELEWDDVGEPVRRIDLQVNDATPRKKKYGIGSES